MFFKILTARTIPWFCDFILKQSKILAHALLLDKSHFQNLVSESKNLCVTADQPGDSLTFEGAVADGADGGKKVEKGLENVGKNVEKWEASRDTLQKPFMT